MSATPESDIGLRKRDHLAIVASGRGRFAQTTTLLDEIRLIHHALPELNLADISLATTLAGLPLAAPLMITGMTGGTAEAGTINRDLARAAAARGLAFGVGSQRPMLLYPELTDSYCVRSVAPDVVLFGNLGAVQARELGAPGVAELAQRIEANAMCIHLNVGQELIQADGDRDFRGLVALLGTLVEHLPVPLVVKETGCGLSPQVARMLVGIGVRTVDVAGAGGTSWIAVEAERAVADSREARLGKLLGDWGLPTALATVGGVRAGLEVIASGGVRHGLDVAHALALGARVGGVAAPVLTAHARGGYAGACEALDDMIATVRMVCLLSGVGTVPQLADAPRLLTPTLQGLLAQL